MMHTSNNLIAEQLLIMISEKMTDTMSTEIAIDHARNNLFKGLPDEFQWVDGSGLSRYNMNTPANLATILKRLLDEKGEAWVSTIFPTAGKHGTLANLLTDELEDTSESSNSGSPVAEKIRESSVFRYLNVMMLSSRDFIAE